MIEFYLQRGNGVATYMQLVQQVRHALRVGMLQPGDQLPTAKDVVTSLAINPNTVLKAYRELEHAGLVQTRPGLGTFIVGELPAPPLRELHALSRRLRQWLDAAYAAGLEDEDVDALIATARQQLASEDIA
ncbi:MAG: GntR family transcriptional regulator [Candidatus Dormibacteraeota bacterium]|nr:GntR family transcriptional regulator [Candidatus Dormibacteraeota bacterium]MBV8444610.1 GntR family transcriptional regulator [Candidatus Dormibacteraeota bacterium]